MVTTCCGKNSFLAELCKLVPVHVAEQNLLLATGIRTVCMCVCVCVCVCVCICVYVDACVNVQCTYIVTQLHIIHYV